MSIRESQEKLKPIVDNLQSVIFDSYGHNSIDLSAVIYALGLDFDSDDALEMEGVVELARMLKDTLYLKLP